MEYNSIFFSFYIREKLLMTDFDILVFSYCIAKSSSFSIAFSTAFLTHSNRYFDCFLRLKDSVTFCFHLFLHLIANYRQCDFLKFPTY